MFCVAFLLFMLCVFDLFPLCAVIVFVSFLCSRDWRRVPLSSRRSTVTSQQQTAATANERRPTALARSYFVSHTGNRFRRRRHRPATLGAWLTATAEPAFFFPFSPDAHLARSSALCFCCPLRCIHSLASTGAQIRPPVRPVRMSHPCRLPALCAVVCRSPLATAFRSCSLW